MFLTCISAFHILFRFVFCFSSVCFCFFFLYFSLEDSTIKPTQRLIPIRVNVSEGGDVTLNCTTKDNEHTWSREGEDPVETTSRTLEDKESKLRIKPVAVRDSGIYYCENKAVKYIFNVTVSGRLLQSCHKNIYTGAVVEFESSFAVFSFSCTF